MILQQVEAEDWVALGAESAVNMDTLRENAPVEVVAEGLVGAAEVATSVERKGTLPENAPPVEVAVAEVATSVERKGTLPENAPPVEVAEAATSVEKKGISPGSAPVQEAVVMEEESDEEEGLAGVLVAPEVEVPLAEAVLPGVEALVAVLGVEVAVDAENAERKATSPVSALVGVAEVRFCCERDEDVRKNVFRYWTVTFCILSALTNTRQCKCRKCNVF